MTRYWLLYNRPADLRSTTVQTCPARNTVASSFYAEINTVNYNKSLRATQIIHTVTVQLLEHTLHS